MKKTYSRIFTSVYENLNTLYFNGRLPKLKVYFVRMSKKNAYAHTIFSGSSRRAKEIHLNRHIEDIGWGDVGTMALVHEMCHVSIGMQGTGNNHEMNHGPLFHEEKRRVIRLGALDEIL